MAIGFESWFFHIVLISILILYIFAAIPIIKRSFKEHNIYKWNNIGLMIILLTICIFIAIPHNGRFIVPYPWSFFYIVFTGFWILVMIISSRLGKKIKSSSENIRTYNKFKRRLLHILAIGYLIVFLFFPLLNLLVFFVPPLMMSTEEYIQTVYSLAFIQDPMATSLSILIFVFLGSTIIQLDAELVRLNWPDVNYPLKKTLIDTNRPDENQSFANHTHMINSFCLGTIILVVFAPNPYIAANSVATMMTITIIADMMAASIGEKYGKKKWRILPNKTIEGTVAGCLTSFIFGLLFLGFLGGLLGAFVFFLTDIVIIKKTTLSDNLLNPILSAIAFTFLIQFPTLLYPLITIPLIGTNLIENPELTHVVATEFWSTFPAFLLMASLVFIICLTIFIKYKRKEIKLLFTGKK